MSTGPGHSAGNTALHADHVRADTGYYGTHPVPDTCVGDSDTQGGPRWRGKTPTPGPTSASTPMNFNFWCRVEPDKPTMASEPSLPRKKQQGQRVGTSLLTRRPRLSETDASFSVVLVDGNVTTLSQEKLL